MLLHLLCAEYDRSSSGLRQMKPAMTLKKPCFTNSLIISRACACVSVFPLFSLIFWFRSPSLTFSSCILRCRLFFRYFTLNFSMLYLSMRPIPPAMNRQIREKSQISIHSATINKHLNTQSRFERRTHTHTHAHI